MQKEFVLVEIAHVETTVVDRWREINQPTCTSVPKCMLTCFWYTELTSPTQVRKMNWIENV